MDWVTFRELATTLKPRSTNAFTIPAPIPCEAPVTMAVLWGLPIVASAPVAEDWNSGLEIRIEHDAVTGLA